MKLLYSGWCLLFLLLAPIATADTIDQGQFTVEFDKKDRAAAEESLRELVAARDEFAARLPLGDEPVTLRIPATENEFRGLSGSYAHMEVSGVTRAEQNSIVVKSPRFRSISDDFRGTLRHELVHILLHRNTDTERLPRWLNEGICMMLANEIRWESTIEVTRMHLTGRIIPLDSLDSAFKQPGSDLQFGDAYSQALTMTRALRNEVGEDAFWAVVADLRTQPFPKALAEKGGITIDQFWDDFNGGLWELSLLTTLRTGSFWGIIAALCLLAGAARWWRNRRIMRGWAREELEEGPEAFDWDRILDDADSWKGERREDR